MARLSHDNLNRQKLRSEKELAQMIVRIARTAPADAIISATETGDLATRVHGLSQKIRAIAAITNAEIYDALTEKGLKIIRLTIRAIDRHGQVRHMLSVVLKSQRISVGDLVLCALGRHVYRKEKGHL
jgi:pyruvate kinase